MAEDIEKDEHFRVERAKNKVLPEHKGGFPDGRWELNTCALC